MKDYIVDQVGPYWQVICPHCGDICEVHKGVRNISCTCGCVFEITDQDLYASGLLEEEDNEEEN